MSKSFPKLKKWAQKAKLSSAAEGKPVKPRSLHKKHLKTSRPLQRKIILLNKPYQTLSQFTDQEGRTTLKDFIQDTEVYAAGRLDYDSEGLLILTNDGNLASKLTQPANKTSKTYWVQVEGAVSQEQLEHLAQGVELKDGMTLPAIAKLIKQPNVWPRTPPIRERKSIPTSWIELSIVEGRNRQVRRMTAKIGLPTLRLIRYRVGNWTIDGIDSGKHIIL